MFNPERVELVRLRLGLTKSGFADRLCVDRKTLYSFEVGDTDLPDVARENLIKISDYTAAFFEAREAPVYPEASGVSFRSLRSLTAASRDAARAAGAIAFWFDDWIGKRYDLPAHDLTPERVTANNPSSAAAQLRAAWGIGARPIGNLLNLLESRGVRVFSLVEETRHLDAYSLWRDDKPYIFLNTMKTAERSRFDAAHELAHLILHRHTGSGHPGAESEADSFASAFLMPEEDLRAEVPWAQDLGHIIKAKRRWGVSAAALAYTLNKMHRLSDWHYRGMCIELGKLGRNVEPDPMPRESSQVWAKILTDLWRQGMPLAHVAEQLAVPERELANLLFGIAAPPDQPPRGMALRAV